MCLQPESSAPAQQEGDNNEEAPKGEKAGAPEGEEQELKSVKSSPATLKAENSFEKKEKRKKKKEKKQVEIQQPLQAQPQAPVQEPIRKRISQTTVSTRNLLIFLRHLHRRDSCVFTILSSVSLS